MVVAYEALLLQVKLFKWPKIDESVIEYFLHSLINGKLLWKKKDNHIRIIRCVAKSELIHRISSDTALFNSGYHRNELTVYFRVRKFLANVRFK